MNSRPIFLRQSVWPPLARLVFADILVGLVEASRALIFIRTLLSANQSTVARDSTRSVLSRLIVPMDFSLHVVAIGRAAMSQKLTTVAGIHD